MISKRQLRNLLRQGTMRGLAPTLVRLASTGNFPRYRFANYAPPDPIIGRRLLGRYLILSILGVGGMSTVYRAMILKRRGPRIVAIKTLRTEGADANFDVVKSRFNREAELLSNLNHPGIVQVHDTGQNHRDQPFFVMDYLRGESLDERIKERGFIDPVDVRTIFGQVCDAVDHAHRCGVIHRDLKPSNIMLMTIEGKRNRTKVVDFGIARFQEDAQKLTRQGELWGSPVYMSPEQCMGGKIDARSDIYSIGISIYEALTGKLPIKGKNYSETMLKQINEKPLGLRVSRADLDIPEKLEAVVMKAMEKDPANRHQTMGELMHELEAAVSLTLTMRSGPPTLQRVEPKVLRSSQHTRWIGLEWLKVTLILIAVGGLLYGEFIVLRGWLADLDAKKSASTHSVKSGER